jgi:hypothetical protein
VRELLFRLTCGCDGLDGLGLLDRHCTKQSENAQSISSEEMTRAQPSLKTRRPEWWQSAVCSDAASPVLSEGRHSSLPAGAAGLGGAGLAPPPKKLKAGAGDLGAAAAGSAKRQGR